MTGLSPANENLWGTVGVHCVQIFALHALDQETGSDCCLPLGKPPIVSGFLGKIFAPLHRQLSEAVEKVISVTCVCQQLVNI